jgi:4-oxalocrotonate tautomerase
LLRQAERSSPFRPVYPAGANTENVSCGDTGRPSPQGEIMPFANFKFPEGVVDAARKEEIIHRTTAMFVEYFGEQARPYSMVLVEEVADGGWGRADETLTLAKMGLARPK